MRIVRQKLSNAKPKHTGRSVAGLLHVDVTVMRLSVLLSMFCLRHRRVVLSRPRGSGCMRRGCGWWRGRWLCWGCCRLCGRAGIERRSSRAETKSRSVHIQGSFRWCLNKLFARAAVLPAVCHDCHTRQARTAARWDAKWVATCAGVELTGVSVKNHWPWIDLVSQAASTLPCGMSNHQIRKQSTSR